MEIKIENVANSAQTMQVAALAREIWNQHFIPIIGQAQVEYMLDRFQSPEAIHAQMESGMEYYIALEDNQPAGYLGIVPDEPPGMLFLSKIYVRQLCRGSGVGTMLLHQTRKRARETSARAIWLVVNRANSDSIAWYQKNGFFITGERKKDIGSGFAMDDYVMECEVG